MSNLLNRKEAADYLNSVGFISSKVTLARMAVNGDGPAYTLLRQRAYYRKEWLDEWLESQIDPHPHSLAHFMRKSGGGTG